MLKEKILDMRDLMHHDKDRAKNYSLSWQSFLLDYSKTPITDEGFAHLLQSIPADLGDHISALQNGELASKHTLLRNSANTANALGERFKQTAKLLFESKWLGYQNQAITDIVHIGVGGSHLGPELLHDALAPYRNQNIKAHFAANLDSKDLFNSLSALNPKTTLVIIASNSFTTEEPLKNYQLAKQWFLQHGLTDADLKNHFIAITAQKDKALAASFLEEQILTIPSSIAGRFSLWSAMSLCTAATIGIEHFGEVLKGAHAMDQHFAQAEFSQNMPVLLALFDHYYRNHCHIHSQAILPYDFGLRLLPAYLQQLCMESCGKRVQKNGNPVKGNTGPIIWGGQETNGQHSFHQLLLQGTERVACDFIVSKDCDKKLYANCLAQSRVLMWGQTEQEAFELLIEKGFSTKEAKTFAPHYVIEGNQPSHTIVMDELSPYTFGALLALYENRVFVQSVLWNIEAFDQYGVEMGKKLAESIYERMTDLKAHEFDGSTELLLSLR